MATAVQWLVTSSSSTKKYRVFNIFGPDSTMRTEVLIDVERRVGAEQRVTFSATETSAAAIWQAVALAPLAGVSSRIIIISSCDRLSDWSGLKNFVTNRTFFGETTLVLLSSRTDPGHRVKVPDRYVPGRFTWKTELTEWEELIKDYASGTYIHCTKPAIDVSGTDGLSPVARWLSLRLGMAQRTAEYLWSRVGESTALARDVVEHLCVLGIKDARLMSETEFRRSVNLILTLHGAEDFAETLLFDRCELTLAALTDHSFSNSDWSRVLGYLSQRLDWLGPLHVALATNEKLSQVESRLGIHRKWILHYAHREDKAHNIARKYDAARVARCRILLGDLDSVLSSTKAVPPGFGEVLLASW